MSKLLQGKCVYFLTASF